MIAEELMTADPFTVGVDDTLQDALEMMTRNEIHALPVLDSGTLVGIITDRDLRTALGPGFRKRDDSQMDDKRLAERVGNWMTPDVEAIYPDTSAADVCRLLVDLRVGALPVVDNQSQLVGIISVTDMLAAAVELFEAEE